MAGYKKKLHIRRILNAPRRLVYEAWTEPNHLATWWGHGRAYTVREIQPRNRLVFVHRCETTDGVREMCLSVRFEERGRKTLLTIEQDIAK